VIGFTTAIAIYARTHDQLSMNRSQPVLDIPDRCTKIFSALRERRGCRHFNRASRLDSFQSLGTTKEKNKPARRFMDVPFVTTQRLLLRAQH